MHCKDERIASVSWGAGNYGAGLQALLKARTEGFTDVVYLDARTDTYLEELSAANIFVVKVQYPNSTLLAVSIEDLSPSFSSSFRAIFRSVATLSVLCSRSVS